MRRLVQTKLKQEAGKVLRGQLVERMANSWKVQARKEAGARSAVPAGVLLVFAGFIVLMGIITAEALYPQTYTTHENEISDLGATRPPDSIILQPSARIFDGMMIVAGASVLVAAYNLQRSLSVKRVSISTGLLGLGMLGVGVFPGNYEVPHPLFALLAFVSGGIAAILSAKVQVAPFSTISRLLGVTALGALVLAMLGDTPVMDELGEGGIERWVAYPVVTWIIAFGAYLLPRKADGAGG